MTKRPFPVAIIGAGPVGLAAAAHLLQRGETPLILEAGTSVGAAVQEWGHVRLFSPWRYLIDQQAETLLTASGWQAPDRQGCPTGQDVVEQYLLPLAQLPQIQAHLSLNTLVVSRLPSCCVFRHPMGPSTMWRCEAKEESQRQFKP